MMRGNRPRSPDDDRRRRYDNRDPRQPPAPPSNYGPPQPSMPGYHQQQYYNPQQQYSHHPPPPQQPPRQPPRPHPEQYHDQRYEQRYEQRPDPRYEQRYEQRYDERYDPRYEQRHEPPRYEQRPDPRYDQRHEPPQYDPRRDQRRTPSPTYSSSSGSSSSLLDISRYKDPKQFGGVLNTFFKAPSENHRQRRRAKRRRRVLYLGANSSSSSVNSDLAYGAGYIKRDKSRSSKSRSVSRSFSSRTRSRRSSHERLNPPEVAPPLPPRDGRERDRTSNKRGKNPDEEIADLGRRLTDLARQDDRRGSGKGKALMLGAAGVAGVAGASLLASRHDRSERGESSRHGAKSHRDESDDESDWEDASDDEDTSSSDGSELAYGNTAPAASQPTRPRPATVIGGAAAAAASMASYRHADSQSEYHRYSDKSSVVDPNLFGPYNSLRGAINTPCGFEDQERASQYRRTSGGSSAYHPPASEYGRHDASRTTVSTTRREYQQQTRPAPRSEYDASRTTVSTTRRESHQTRPGPASEYGQYDASRTTVSTTRRDSQQQTGAAPVPIQQPIPKVPVSSRVYDAHSREQSEDKSHWGEAATAALAGAAVGATIASSSRSNEKRERRDERVDDKWDRDSRRYRNDEHRRREPEHDSRSQVSKYDSNTPKYTDDRDARKASGYDDYDDTPRKKEEKQKQKEKQEKKTDVVIIPQKDQVSYDYRGHEVNAEHRKDLPEDRRIDNARAEPQALPPSTMAGQEIAAGITQPALSTSRIDPFLYQVADDAFMTPRTRSPERPLTPTVVTVDREPNFDDDPPRSSGPYSRLSRKDSYEIEKIVEQYRNGTQNVPRPQDSRPSYGSREHEEKTKDSHDQVEKSTIPAAPVAVQQEHSEKRQGKPAESVSRESSSAPKDPVQEKADQFWRESEIARRKASEEIRSRSSSPDRSVVDKWRDEDVETFTIVTPPDTEKEKEKEKEAKPSIYDGPNADVMIDNEIFPHDEHRFRTSPTDMHAPPFYSRDPSAERERPVLNLVRPTPVPSRAPSPSPEKRETTKEVEEPPKVIEEPPTVVDEPRKVVDELPRVVDAPPTVVYELPAVVDEAPRTVEELPKSIELSKSVDEPPRVAEELPKVVEEPLKPVGDLPKSAETEDFIFRPKDEDFQPIPPAKSVSWGENQTKSFDIETPDIRSDSEGYVSAEVSSDKPRPRLNRDSRWGAIAAALSGSSMEPINEPDIELTPLDGGHRDLSAHPAQIYADDSSQEPPPVPGPKPTSPRMEQMPGGYADDIEFAATLAAGLKDTGFDPNMVIEDPTYSRRDSPPGVQDANGDTWYKQPYAETVTDFHELPAPKSVPDQGFVLGEVETPQEEKTAPVVSEQEKPREIVENVQTPEKVGSPSDEVAARSDVRDVPLELKEDKPEPEQRKREKVVVVQDPSPNRSEETQRREFGEQVWENTPRPKTRTPRRRRDYDDDDDSYVSPQRERHSRHRSADRSREVRSDDEYEASRRERRRHASRKDDDLSRAIPPALALGALAYAGHRLAKEARSRSRSRERRSEDERETRRHSRRHRRDRDSYVDDDDDIRSRVSAPVSSRDGYSSSHRSRRERDSYDDDVRSRGSLPGSSRDGHSSTYRSKKDKRKGAADDDFYDAPRERRRDDDFYDPPRERRRDDDFHDIPRERRRDDDYDDRDVNSVVSESRTSERRRERRQHRRAPSEYDDDIKSVVSAPGSGTSRRRKDFDRRDPEKRSFSGGLTSVFRPKSGKDEKGSSFLDNADTVGAGVGLAVAAFITPGVASRLNATDIPASQELKGFDESRRNRSFETFDPEVAPRAIKPAIDPQYGDLLPLPPSEPGSPVSEPEQLPALPGSRPDTPPQERVKQRLTHHRRRSTQGTPSKSPSHTAIPIQLRLGNRSNPGSPIAYKPSPTNSPVANVTDSPGVRRSSRPMSWDSAREFKPLYLVEHSRQFSPADHMPLPELPPIPPSEASEPPSRASPEPQFRDDADYSGLGIEGAGTLGRALQINTAVVPNMPKGEGEDSEETTPRAETGPEFPSTLPAKTIEQEVSRGLPVIEEVSNDVPQVSFVKSFEPVPVDNTTPISVNTVDTTAVPVEIDRSTPTKQINLDHKLAEALDDLTSADEHFSDAADGQPGTPVTEELATPRKALSIDGESIKDQARDVTGEVLPSIAAEEILHEPVPEEFREPVLEQIKEEPLEFVTEPISEVTVETVKEPVFGLADPFTDPPRDEAREIVTDAVVEAPEELIEEPPARSLESFQYEMNPYVTEAVSEAISDVKAEETSMEIAEDIPEPSLNIAQDEIQQPTTESVPDVAVEVLPEPAVEQVVDSSDPIDDVVSQPLAVVPSDAVEEVTPEPPVEEPAQPSVEPKPAMRGFSRGPTNLAMGSGLSSWFKSLIEKKPDHEEHAETTRDALEDETQTPEPAVETVAEAAVEAAPEEPTEIATVDDTTGPVIEPAPETVAESTDAPISDPIGPLQDMPETIQNEYTIDEWGSFNVKERKQIKRDLRKQGLEVVIKPSTPLAQAPKEPETKPEVAEPIEPFEPVVESAPVDDIPRELELVEPPIGLSEVPAEPDAIQQEDISKELEVVELTEAGEHAPAEVGDVVLEPITAEAIVEPVLSAVEPTDAIIESEPAQVDDVPKHAEISEPVELVEPVAEPVEIVGATEAVAEPVEADVDVAVEGPAEVAPKAENEFTQAEWDSFNSRDRKKIRKDLRKKDLELVILEPPAEETSNEPEPNSEQVEATEPTEATVEFTAPVPESTSEPSMDVSNSPEVVLESSEEIQLTQPVPESVEATDEPVPAQGDETSKEGEMNEPAQFGLEPIQEAVEEPGLVTEAAPPVELVAEPTTESIVEPTVDVTPKAENEFTQAEWDSFNSRDRRKIRKDLKKKELELVIVSPPPADVGVEAPDASVETIEPAFEPTDVVKEFEPEFTAQPALENVVEAAPDADVAPGEPIEPVYEYVPETSEPVTEPFSEPASQPVLLETIPEDPEDPEPALERDLAPADVVIESTSEHVAEPAEPVPEAPNKAENEFTQAEWESFNSKDRKKIRKELRKKDLEVVIVPPTPVDEVFKELSVANGDAVAPGDASAGPEKPEEQVSSSLEEDAPQVIVPAYSEAEKDQTLEEAQESKQDAFVSTEHETLDKQPVAKPADDEYSAWDMEPEIVENADTALPEGERTAPLMSHVSEPLFSQGDLPLEDSQALSTQFRESFVAPEQTSNDLSVDRDEDVKMEEISTQPSGEPSAEVSIDAPVQQEAQGDVEVDEKESSEQAKSVAFDVSEPVNDSMGENSEQTEPLVQEPGQLDEATPVTTELSTSLDEQATMGAGGDNTETMASGDLPAEPESPRKSKKNKKKKKKNSISLDDGELPSLEPSDGTKDPAKDDPSPDSVEQLEKGSGEATEAPPPSDELAAPPVEADETPEPTPELVPEHAPEPAPENEDQTKPADVPTPLETPPVQDVADAPAADMPDASAPEDPQAMATETPEPLSPKKSKKDKKKKKKKGALDEPTEPELEEASAEPSNDAIPTEHEQQTTTEPASEAEAILPADETLLAASHENGEPPISSQEPEANPEDERGGSSPIPKDTKNNNAKDIDFQNLQDSKIPSLEPEPGLAKEDAARKSDEAGDLGSSDLGEDVKGKGLAVDIGAPVESDAKPEPERESEKQQDVDENAGLSRTQKMLMKARDLAAAAAAAALGSVELGTTAEPEAIPEVPMESVEPGAEAGPKPESELDRSVEQTAEPDDDSRPKPENESSPVAESEIVPIVEPETEVESKSEHETQPTAQAETQLPEVEEPVAESTLETDPKPEHKAELLERTMSNVPEPELEAAENLNYEEKLTESTADDVTSKPGSQALPLENPIDLAEPATEALVESTADVETSNETSSPVPADNTESTVGRTLDEAQLSSDAIALVPDSVEHVGESIHFEDAPMPTFQIDPLLESGDGHEDVYVDHDVTPHSAEADGNPVSSVVEKLEPWASEGIVEESTAAAAPQPAFEVLPGPESNQVEAEVKIDNQGDETVNFPMAGNLDTGSPVIEEAQPRETDVSMEDLHIPSTNPQPSRELAEAETFVGLNPESEVRQPTPGSAQDALFEPSEPIGEPHVEPQVQTQMEPEIPLELAEDGSSRLTPSTKDKNEKGKATESLVEPTIDSELAVELPHSFDEVNLFEPAGESIGGPGQREFGLPASSTESTEKLDVAPELSEIPEELEQAPRGLETIREIETGLEPTASTGADMAQTFPMEPSFPTESTKQLDAEAAAGLAGPMNDAEGSQGASEPAKDSDPASDPKESLQEPMQEPRAVLEPTTVQEPEKPAEDDLSGASMSKKSKKKKKKEKKLAALARESEEQTTGSDNAPASMQPLCEEAVNPFGSEAGDLGLAVDRSLSPLRFELDQTMPKGSDEMQTMDPLNKAEGPSVLREVSETSLGDATAEDVSVADQSPATISETENAESIVEHPQPLDVVPEEPAEGAGANDAVMKDVPVLDEVTLDNQTHLQDQPAIAPAADESTLSPSTEKLTPKPKKDRKRAKKLARALARAESSATADISPDAWMEQQPEQVAENPAQSRDIVSSEAARDEFRSAPMVETLPDADPFIPGGWGAPQNRGVSEVMDPSFDAGDEDQWALPAKKKKGKGRLVTDSLDAEPNPFAPAEPKFDAPQSTGLNWLAEDEDADWALPAKRKEKKGTRALETAQLENPWEPTKAEPQSTYIDIPAKENVETARIAPEARSQTPVIIEPSRELEAAEEKTIEPSTSKSRNRKRRQASIDAKQSQQSALNLDPQDALPSGLRTPPRIRRGSHGPVPITPESDKLFRSPPKFKEESATASEVAAAVAVGQGGFAALAGRLGSKKKDREKRRLGEAVEIDRDLVLDDDFWGGSIEDGKRRREIGLQMDDGFWGGSSEDGKRSKDNLLQLDDDFWGDDQPIKAIPLDFTDKARDKREKLKPTSEEDRELAASHDVTESLQDSSRSKGKNKEKKPTVISENLIRRDSDDMEESPVLGRHSDLPRATPQGLLRRGTGVEEVVGGGLLKEDNRAPTSFVELGSELSEFRHSPACALPPVQEIPEVEVEPVKKSSTWEEANRDSGFAEDSPNVQLQDRRLSEEQRDSGVHTGDWVDGERERKAIQTPDPERRLRRSPRGTPGLRDTPTLRDTPVLREPPAPVATPEPEKKKKPYGALAAAAAAAAAGTAAGMGVAALRSAASTPSRSVSDNPAVSRQSSPLPGAVPRRSLSNTSLSRRRTPEPLNFRPQSPGINRASGTSTPPLRRIDRRMSSDLRALRSQNTAGTTSSTTTTIPVANEGRVRTKDMADVYDGFGEGRIGSPRSPTRPHSMRRRQSMQVLELENRVEQLLAENRALTDARANAESGITHRAATTLADRDAEIDALKQSLKYFQNEVARLTEVNDGLASANAELANKDTARFTDLETRHATTARELDAAKGQFDQTLEEKDAEIAKLRAQLEAAKEKIRDMQRQILESKARESHFLNIRDEDHFDHRCQQLCSHVQQWVLRFSKFSDMRACRLTSEINDEKTIDRLDNAVLDGSDVDTYLRDRVKRRDIFMSMTMNMIWEFVFTRYLFGMDREQRQKLKSLEKLLTEVGPPEAVRQWRAVTLTLLSKRDGFKRQRDLDTEAVVQAIFQTLCKILPPPSNLEDQIQSQLRRVMREAVGLSIEMRTQKAEYMMLPPLQPEYDADGELAATVQFNASMMNERSGTADMTNEELEAQHAVVRVVLFPLVVKKGDDDGRGDEEIVVCPAQVLIAHSKHFFGVSSSVGARSHVSLVGDLGQPEAEYLEGGI